LKKKRRGRSLSTKGFLRFLHLLSQMFCGTLLTIKVESSLLSFSLEAQRKGGVGKSVRLRRDFNLNYD